MQKIDEKWFQKVENQVKYVKKLTILILYVKKYLKILEIRVKVWWKWVRSAYNDQKLSESWPRICKK